MVSAFRWNHMSQTKFLKNYWGVPECSLFPLLLPGFWYDAILTILYIF
eukprot:SAG31_NODE_3636_length_4035_cov_2.230691_3_plen_48_part_00